ncbi:MAG: hypothetical protein J0L81_13705 [Caulobacterales bacterium]|jgi:hypothetical protein|nr:hypothetical protein [Caulobacterales bacterium]
MSDVEDHVRATIRYWVWGGYYGPRDFDQMIEDIIEEGVTTEWAQSIVQEEIARKTAAEAHWPARTDCDRLDEAFSRLDSVGICAVQNAGYTSSDGHEEVELALDQRGRDRCHGYCFFHGQDLERAIDGHGLMLAFGDLRDDVKRSASVAQQVCSEMRAAGFAVQWNGDVGQRIEITSIDWKRRLKR